MVRLEDKLAVTQTALIVVDVQHDFLSKGGALDRAGRDVRCYAGLVERIAEMIRQARAHGSKIVFLQSAYADASGRPYVSETFLDQARRRGEGLYTDVPVCVEGTWGADFVPPVEPQHGDVVVQKHCFSGFEGTELDEILRDHGIRNLIFVGVVTHVCVESTVRQAFFRDYRCLVVEDGVGGWSEELHRSSLRVMDWGFAEVVKAERLYEIWDRQVSEVVSSAPRRS